MRVAAVSLGPLAAGDIVFHRSGIVTAYGPGADHDFMPGVDPEWIMGADVPAAGLFLEERDDGKLYPLEVGR